MPDVRSSPSGPPVETALNTDEVENLSVVPGLDVTLALDALYLRAIRYLDLDDSPVALWNFNGVITAVRGPNFTTGAGVPGFIDAAPGFRALDIPVNCRMQTAVSAVTQLAGDMSIEAIVQLDAIPSNLILVSQSSSASDINPVNNTLYEIGCPSDIMPRPMQFNWEQGAGVNESFSTPTVNGSASFPFNHQIISVGWRRLGNVLSPFINGQPFGPSSGVLTPPTGGSNTILCIGGAAGAVTPIRFAIASLAIYDYARTNQQWEDSYNRSLGEGLGFIGGSS